MEHQRDFPVQVRRKTSTLLMIGILAAFILSITAVFSLMRGYRKMMEQTALLEQQAAAVAVENQQLEQSIDQLGTPENFRKIAQEELGLVDPGTIIFEPQQ